MDNLKTLDSVIRQQFASVVWSHKIQIKQADIHRSRYLFLKVVDIVTAGLTSTGMIAILLNNQDSIKVLTALVSFFSFFCTTFLQTFNLQSSAEQNELAANRLWRVREDLVILLTKIKTDSINFDIALTEYESIISSLNEIYKEMPEATSMAVKKARKALNETKDNTYSEYEIDSYLPFGLRSK